MDRASMQAETEVPESDPGDDEQFRVLATQMGCARDKLAPGRRSFPLGRDVVFYVPVDDGIDAVALQVMRDV